MANLPAAGTAIGMLPLDNNSFIRRLYTLKAFTNEHDLKPHLEGEVELPQYEASKKVTLKQKS